MGVIGLTVLLGTGLLTNVVIVFGPVLTSKNHNDEDSPTTLDLIQTIYKLQSWLTNEKIQLDNTRSNGLVIFVRGRNVKKLRPNGGPQRPSFGPPMACEII